VNPGILDVDSLNYAFQFFLSFNFIVYALQACGSIELRSSACGHQDCLDLSFPVFINIGKQLRL